MRTSNFAKYQLYDSVKAIGIFYFIIGLIFLLSIIPVGNSVNISIGGMELASIIFIFIAGLNSFKGPFRFSQANNLSRWSFYKGTAISLIIIALFMSIVDTILSQAYKINSNYETMFYQIYRNKNIFSAFIWHFAILCSFIFIGWCITMLYYQSNSLMKVVISILPVFLIIFVSAISTSLDGKVYREIGDFLLLIFGFKNGDNSYIGALSMVVFTGIISAVNYLLVRKAPIKD